MQELVVAAVAAAPKFRLRGSIYRNCYGPQSMSEEGDEAEEERDKAVEEMSGAEPRRSGRARKRAQTGMEREITEGHRHGNVAHALLTAGSGGSGSGGGCK